MSIAGKVQLKRHSTYGGGSTTHSIIGAIIGFALVAVGTEAIQWGKVAGIPELMVLGMIASLFAAGSWLLMASFLGWPVSTTHSIIGAIIGFALVAVGTDAIQWGKVAGIVGSWIVTPAISGFIAYLIFMSAQKLIFDTDAPLKNAKRFVPIYMGLAGFIHSSRFSRERLQPEYSALRRHL